jgi:hypothetical protein
MQYCQTLLDAALALSAAAAAAALGRTGVGRTHLYVGPQRASTGLIKIAAVFSLVAAAFFLLQLSAVARATTLVDAAGGGGGGAANLFRLGLFTCNGFPAALAAFFAFLAVRRKSRTR